MTTKEKLITELKSSYSDFNMSVFNKCWNEANAEDLNLHDIVCKIQPLIIKEKRTELSFIENCYLCSYLCKYISLGGDPEYFTSGAGAGDCVIA